MQRASLMFLLAVACSSNAPTATQTMRATPVAPARASSDANLSQETETSGTPAASATPTPSTTRPVIPVPDGDLPAVTPEPPPIKLPVNDPAFAEPAKTWWKRRSPCPKGSRIEVWKGDVPLQGGRVTVAYACKRGDTEHGPFASLYSDGTLAEAGWKRDGKFHGLRREFFPDGKLAVELTYVDGREHGPQLMLHRNGKIWRRGTKRDDKRYGRWFVGGDSGFRSESYYGIDGPSIAMGWYPDGRVAFRAELRDRKLDGEQVVWGPDGEVFGHARFSAGSGGWTFWRHSGEHWAKLTCTGGRVTVASYWDEHGAHIVTYSQPDPKQMPIRTVGPAGKTLLAKRERLPDPTDSICTHPSFPSWVISGPARVSPFGR